MKLHLHQHPDDTLDGYVNVCLGIVPDYEGELDAAADDAEVTELVANNILEFVQLHQLLDLLKLIVRKLRHKGKLIVTGVDAYSVAKDYVNYKLSIEDLNILLHGRQRDNAQDVKMATLTMHGLVNFLRNDMGLKITRQAIEEYEYVIEAERP